MSLQNILIPRCRAAAVTTKDGQTITHYCEHPFGHDGDHGSRSPSGSVWLSWSHIIQQSPAIPPLPGEHPHRGHPAGERLFSCCACSGRFNPACPVCLAGP